MHARRPTEVVAVSAHRIAVHRSLADKASRFSHIGRLHARFIRLDGVVAKALSASCRNATEIENPRCPDTTPD
jgi:hypothetical protein